MPTSLGRHTDVKIGVTKETMEDVLVEPHIEFQAGAEAIRTTCAQEKYVGAPRCRWTYPGMLLSGEEFWQLKGKVGNTPAATVYIDIPTQTMNFETYTPLVATYQAVMHWPTEDVKIVNYNRWQLPDDGILFTRLEPV